MDKTGLKIVSPLPIKTHKNVSSYSSNLIISHYFKTFFSAIISNLTFPHYRLKLIEMVIFIVQQAPICGWIELEIILSIFFAQQFISNLFQRQILGNLMQNNCANVVQNYVDWVSIENVQFLC